MSDAQQTASAADQGTAWLDPWLKLREMTSRRNEVFAIVNRYDRMKALAIEQYNTLKEMEKTSQATLDTLLVMIKWLAEKREPLWDILDKMDAKLREETERLNNA